MSLHSLYRQRPLHLPASQGWLFLLHRDNDFLYSLQTSAAAPFFTPHPTPRVVVGSGVVIIPGTAGWCMQLSNSTASGRGATNTASPATPYVHASLLLLQFPQPVLCRHCPPRVFFPPRTRLLMYTNINHNNSGYRQ